MRGLQRLLAVGLAVVGFGTTPLSAQQAATAGALDPVYEDLAYLESRGLVPRGIATIRPLSFRRISAVVAVARAMALATGPDGGMEATDVDAVLTRLESRFSAGDDGFDALIDLELGGGRAAARDIPDNDLGDLDVVLAPLWANRGGRAYGDEITAAATGRMSLAWSEDLAVTVEGRAGEYRATGLPPVSDALGVRALAARARLGRFALLVGRDGWWQGRDPENGLLMSYDGPPLDQIRLTTDVPLSLYVLGDTELLFAVADLGPRQNHPGAKLFGFTLSSRPVPSLVFDLHLLNKQFGEGAPEAGRADRIKDISFIWDLFRKGRDYTFSEKLIGLDFAWSRPESAGLRLFGGVALTDFDPDRVGDILDADTGYRLGLAFDRLGPAGRHGIEIEAQRIGPLPYRHHQFTTGFAVDGRFQGSIIGPDGRGLRGRYDYRAPADGWGLHVEGAVESRSADLHAARYTPFKDIYLVTDLPDETRARLRGGMAWRSGSGLGVAAELGAERIGHFAHESGDARTHFALLLRVSRSF